MSFFKLKSSFKLNSYKHVLQSPTRRYLLILPIKFFSGKQKKNRRKKAERTVDEKFEFT